MSNVIVSNHTAVACTPPALELSCGITGGKMNYQVKLSTEKILFKRNGIANVAEILLDIVNPVYIGCDSFNMGDTGSFPTNLEQVTVSFYDVDGKDTSSVSGVFDVVVTSSPNNYTLVLSANIGVVSLKSKAGVPFTGCMLGVQIFAGDGINPVKLTSASGFSSCDPIHGSCAVVCGKILLCDGVVSGDVINWTL